MNSVDPTASNAAVLSLFSHPLEDTNQLVEALCFDAINDSFFRYAPPETLISTLHFWLENSAVLNGSFWMKKHVGGSSISLSMLCVRWITLFSEIADKQSVYATNKRRPSDVTVSTLLSDFFLAPKTELIGKSSEVSCLLRLLSFLALRHYFKDTDELLKARSAENRIKGLLTFIRGAEVKLATTQALDALNTLDDVFEFCRPLLQKEIDRRFFSQHLYGAFDEDIILSSDNEVINYDPPTRVQELSHVTQHDNTDSVFLLDDNGSSNQRNLALLELIDEQPEASDGAYGRKLPMYVIELKQMCVPASLTSKEFIEANFRNYKRRPEYPLQLPGLNYSLLTSEKRILVKHLLAELLTGESSTEALIVLLMLTTASTLQKLTTFVITTSVDDRYINAICLQKGEWRRHSLVFDNSFQPEEQQSPWLKPHDNFLHLRLPTAIIEAINRLVLSHRICAADVKKGLPLYQLLELDNVKRLESLNAYLNTLKSPINYGFRQLTPKAMRFALYSEIAHDVDASTAALIFATSEFSNPITLYYLSASEKSLQGHYNQALRALGFDEHSESAGRDVFVGSRMTVDLDALATRIQRKNNALRELLASTDHDVKVVIQRHNEFASFVTLAFAFSGALREQADYFFDHASISESGNFFFVCDKYHRGENPTRLIPLSPLLASLLQEYKRQLRVTSNALLACCPDLAALLFSFYQPRRHSINETEHREIGLPLLGLIIDGQWQSISSATINTYLGEDFTLPGNFTRHVACSHIPQPLLKYRQLLLGHNNQGHHVLDEMSLSVTWLDDEGLSHQLDALLRQLGFEPLQAQSLRGAFSLPRLPSKSMFYPPGYLERQTHSAMAYRFARRHFKALLNQTETGGSIERAVAELPSHVNAPQNGKSLEHLVQQYYTRWQATYEKVGHASVVAEMNALNKSDSDISLRSVQNSRYVRQLQLDFLRCVANGTLPIKSQSTILLSLALFQPRVALPLSMQERTANISIQRYQNTLLLQTRKTDEESVTSPINWLTSFLLMQSGQPEECRIRIADTNTLLKTWVKGAAERIGRELPRFSSLIKLCRFVSAYGFDTQSRLSVAASKDTIIAGDYSLEDIGRLLKHSHGHLHAHKNVNVPPLSKPAKPRRILNALNSQAESSTFELQKEREFVKQVQMSLLEMNDSSKDISSEKVILRHWANYTDSAVKTLNELIETSSMCSEFLILWLVYGVKVSRRSSPIKKGSNVSSSTVYKYLNIIAAHLQGRVLDATYLMNDEESFEELYLHAISDTHHEDKHEVYRCLKDFHNEINQSFTVDMPDWGMLEQMSFSKVNRRVGTARLLAMADYERVKQYFLQCVESRSGAGLTQLEVDMHIVVLALGYRLGFRKREIRNLQIRHVNEDMKLITVTSTRNYATKSVNSPRRVEASLFFDEQEWSSFTHLNENAKKMGVGIASPRLFGGATLENRLMKIDSIVCNIMDVCRAFGGDHKLRFYDLRHSFINYTLLILGKLYLDQRYMTSLAKFARCEPRKLPIFREQLARYLIGGQAEVGGNLIYGLARRLGHSPITMRQYYIHTLNVIDDVMVNRLLTQLVPQGSMFGFMKECLHETNSAFRAEPAVRNAIKARSCKTLNKQPQVSFNDIHAAVKVLEPRYQFESVFKRIYTCMADAWQLKNDAVAQRMIVEKAAIPEAVWTVLHEKLLETDYQGVYLPQCLALRSECKLEKVTVALRYMRVTQFGKMIDAVSGLYRDKPSELSKLVLFYLSHQYGDEVIVCEKECDELNKLLRPFDDILMATLVLTTSAHHRRGRGIRFYRLELAALSAKRKTSNDKFNFLIVLTHATLTALSHNIN